MKNKNMMILLAALSLLFACGEKQPEQPLLGVQMPEPERPAERPMAN